MVRGGCSGGARDVAADGADVFPHPAHGVAGGESAKGHGGGNGDQKLFHTGGNVQPSLADVEPRRAAGYSAAPARAVTGA